MKNISIFLSENFQFVVVRFSIYLDRRVFVMENRTAVGISEVRNIFSQFNTRQCCYKKRRCRNLYNLKTFQHTKCQKRQTVFFFVFFLILYIYLMQGTHQIYKTKCKYRLWGHPEIQ